MNKHWEEYTYFLTTDLRKRNRTSFLMRWSRLTKDEQRHYIWSLPSHDQSLFGRDYPHLFQLLQRKERTYPKWKIAYYRKKKRARRERPAVISPTDHVTSLRSRKLFPHFEVSFIRTM